MSNGRPFRVIIVGGGISGLALANALEKADIDYILLERRNEFAPQIGASIGLLPNGNRILDQLGVYDRVSEEVLPIVWWTDRDSSGKPVAPRNDAAALAGVRTGYGVSFGDRQTVLRILFEHVKDKSKLHVNKKVDDVVHSRESVLVRCEDGTSYEGDILVGGDGVNSTVRQHLWRLAEPEHPNLVRADKTAMRADYRCLFGIASPTKGLTPGDGDYCYDHGLSALIVIAKGGRTYYFVIEKLDRTYEYGEIPIYSQAQAEEFAAKRANMKIRENITFGEVRQKTISSALVALEEGKFKLWTHGRIACIGDSAHKMTPNLGSGGNAAIESAAALANAIVKVVDESSSIHPTHSDIEKHLASYQQKRETRAAAVVDYSAMVTRLQALETLFDRFWFRFAVPNLGDFLADLACNVYTGATLIEYLPPPKISLMGTMPFNPAQGVGNNESKAKRALVALPFLGLFFLARAILDGRAVGPRLDELIKLGNVTWVLGSVPIQYSFYNIKWLDEFWVPINLFFAPTLYNHDPPSRLQAISFLTDCGVVLAIWLFESVRRANAFTLSQLPSLFTLAGQFIGIGILNPLYYFFSYVFAPIENFSATDQRLTNMKYALGILPALVIGFYTPLYGMYFWPTLPGRQSWLFLWQMFPVWLSIVVSVLGYIFPNTIMTDRLRTPKRDLPVMRYTIGTCVALSATVWLSTVLFGSCYSLAEIFIPTTISNATAPDLNDYIQQFLKLDEIFLFAGTFMWLGYCFWDMKHAGMVERSWAAIVVYAVATTLALGPGAAAGLGWLWREDVISNKRHKDAITADTVMLKRKGCGSEGEKRQNGVVG